MRCNTSTQGPRKRDVTSSGRTAVRFTKRPLPWSRVGSEGAIHRAVHHLSPQGQTPNGYLTLAHPPTHRACPATWLHVGTSHLARLLKRPLVMAHAPRRELFSKLWVGYAQT